jgi:hypothetical protein
MLRYMLCAHSRIYIPPESNFIPRCFGRHPTASLDRQAALEAVRTIEQYRVFFKDWQGDLPEPGAVVDDSARTTPAALIDTLYQRYAAQHGAVRWGDKSPIYTGCVDMLATMFPTAQFVHIVRDGRDVTTSMLRAYTTKRFFYFDVYYAARTWRQDVHAARASGARLGAARYKELHYEDLVADPVAHLQELCSFLRERYEPPMAHPEDVARRSYHSKGIHAATRRPVTTERAGMWRTLMSRADLGIVQSAAGDLLAELGYETEGSGTMRARTALRYGGLRLKYTTVSAGRATLRAGGLFHPTALLARRRRSPARCGTAAPPTRGPFA